MMHSFIHELLFTVLLFLLSRTKAEDPESHTGRLSSQHIMVANTGTRYPHKTLHREWCLKGKKGDKFCSGNLHGYYICGDNILTKTVRLEYWWKEPYNRTIEKLISIPAEYKSCPDGTHCSCNLEKTCNPENICIDYKKPYDMLHKATFTFKANNHFTHYFDFSRGQIHRYSGMIKQDVANKKYLQIITCKRYPYNTFELIIPGKNGKFIRYYGNQYGKCSISMMDYFRPFGFSIANYKLSKSNGTHDTYTYSYRKLDENYGGGIHRWLYKTIKDPVKKTMKPLYSEYFRTGEGGYEDLPYIYKQSVNWYTKSYNTRIPKQQFWYKNMFKNKMVNKDWFQVSTCCKMTHLLDEARKFTYRDSRVQQKLIGWYYWTNVQMYIEMKDNICSKTLKVKLTNGGWKSFGSMEELKTLLNNIH